MDLITVVRFGLLKNRTETVNLIQATTLFLFFNNCIQKFRSEILSAE